MPRKGLNDENFEAWSTRVQADHYLHLGAMGVLLLYIYQLHGIWAALAGLVLIPTAISVINIAILGSTGSLRLVKLNRWAVLIFLFLLLALSNTTVESVS